MGHPFDSNNPGIGGLDELTSFEESIIEQIASLGNAGDVLVVNGGATGVEWSNIAGYTNLTEFIDQTAWRVFYSNGSGDVTELALGASGTFLGSNGVSSAPSWSVPAGAGDVSKVGTPANNQMAVWTGDGTLEGTSDFTYDGTNLNLITGKNFQIAGATILADSAGTTTLSNIDALDSTTEDTIEAAIDTLANLTSIQGRTVTLADAGANAFFGWDDTAGAYENLTAAEAEAIIEPLIDTLANLTSIQGHTVTLADAGANAFFGWDDGAGAYENLTAAEAEAIIEPLIDTLANLTSVQGLTITLADAGADAIFGWDDSASAYQNLSAADALVALGVTSSAAELNILDGATLTVTELNYVDGVTSAIQTQLDAKQPLDADLTTLATAFTTASASGAASLKFAEDTDNGSNAVTLQGPASTADVTLTLPAATDTLVGKATTDTFTNKTIDANGTGNSITNLEVADFTAAAIVTAADTIAANDNDTTLPTSAAVIDYVAANGSVQTLTATPGQNFNGSSTPVPLYLHTDGKVYIADANDTARDDFIGFSQNNVTDAETNYLASGNNLVDDTFDVEIPAGTKRALVVWWFGHRNTPTVVPPTGITWNGNAMTKVHDGFADSGDPNTWAASMWVLAVGDSGSAQNQSLVISGAGYEGEKRGTHWAVYDYVNQSDPIGASAENNGSSGTASVTIDPDNANSKLVFGYHITSGNTITAASGQTQRQETLDGSGGGDQKGELNDFAQSTGASTAYTATFTSTAWYAVALELNPDATATTATYQFAGLLDAFSGLTIGSNYYLQDTAGTIGVTPGTATIKVGRAVTATKMLINQP